MSNYTDTVSDEIRDLRREREILTDEILDGKNKFANEVRDILGEDIRKVLVPKEKPVEKKKSRFKLFLDKLARLA